MPLLVGIACLWLLGGSAHAQQTLSRWSEPQNLSKTSTQSNTPSIAVDPSGVVHVVWTEELAADTAPIFYTRFADGAWSSPLDILLSPMGGVARDPEIRADNDGYLHLVWRGCGGICYSQAYAPNAGSSQGWSSPANVLPSVASADAPDLIVGPKQRLDMVYATPLGSNSGIYYIHSPDRADTWQEPVAVFTNPNAERMVSKPRLAVTSDNTLHVVWVESNYPDTFPPIGIRYARSEDGGRTWSEPLSLTDGPYDDPAIAIRNDQEIHVVWSGTANDRFKFHRWSADRGITWGGAWRNTDLGGYQGRPALIVDSDQTLHWIQVGTVSKVGGVDALYYSAWTGHEWSPGEVLLKNTASGQNPGNVDASIGLGNQIHVVVANPLDVQRGKWQMDVFYTQKQTDARVLPRQTLPLLATPLPIQPTATSAFAVQPTAPPLPRVTLEARLRDSQTRVDDGNPWYPLIVALAPAALVVIVAAAIASWRARS
ncbi:MAG: sialidase family protein [Anaerolineae bacterium]